MCAASSDKRATSDTHASASCEEKQTGRDRRYNYKRQADVPAAADGAWHVPIAGVRRARARWNKNPRGTGRSLSTRASSSDMMVQASANWLTRLDHSVFNSEPGKCPHRAGSETRETKEVGQAALGPGSQTMTSFFMRKPNCLTTVLHRTLGFLRLMDRKNRHRRTMNSRGTVGTSTRAVASTVEKNKTCSSSSVRGNAKIRYARRTCENNVTQVL